MKSNFLPPPLDGMLVCLRASPSMKFAVIHLYIWMDGGIAGVWRFAQEHSAMTSAKARTQTTRSELHVLAILFGLCTYTALIIVITNDP